MGLSHERNWSFVTAQPTARAADACLVRGVDEAARPPCRHVAKEMVASHRRHVEIGKAVVVDIADGTPMPKKDAFKPAC